MAQRLASTQPLSQDISGDKPSTPTGPSEERTKEINFHYGIWRMEKQVR
jgi:hypothetical protein